MLSIHRVAALHQYWPTVDSGLSILDQLGSQSDVIMSWLRLPSYSNSFPHLYIRYVQNVRAFGILSQGNIGAPLSIPPAKLALDVGILGHSLSGNDAITPYLRLTSTSDHYPHPY